MKAEIYTNCSLVRIPVKAGVEEYYLPQNVDWANRKIDKMLIVAPSVACVDPVDGITPIVDASTIADLYVNLYDSANKEILHDVSYENILHRNNGAIVIDAKLNLSLCRLYFTTTPAADATLLIYVFYGTRTEEYYDLPKKSVTCVFPLQANEQKSFREIINDYVHALPARILGIIAWTGESAPAWLTLRDKELTYQMANVHTELCRPDAAASEAYNTQAALFLTNELDIDFDYSNIREAAGQNATQKITFLFG